MRSARPAYPSRPTIIGRGLPHHSSDSGDLRDLVALEEENKRLKNLFADRLRKENAELKKKLGLA
ncbi:hypothetical protein [Mesorhizobium huakuii]|uniref:hypothetical protein n=1 Tax=Mesorhizobium huakuii TaxID=28104 RepID=UPI0032AFCB9C